MPSGVQGTSSSRQRVTVGDAARPAEPLRHSITAELGCTYTKDGRHYDHASVKEVDALLDMI